MIRTTLYFSMAFVLLCAMFLLGGLRPFHPTDSYVLTGVPIMVVEAALALCFARGFVVGLFTPVNQGDGIGRLRRPIVVPLLTLVAAAMVPTILILYADQALDGSPGVTEALTVASTYSNAIGRGGTWYYAVVPATTPPPLLSPSSGSHTDIKLPRATWQRLVAGRSTLTLTVHPGRFGLPWYQVVGMTI